LPPDIPKLFNKIKQHNTKQKDGDVEQLMDLLASKSFNEILDITYKQILDDQIEISGGWGKSQYDVMKRITKVEMSPLEKREGGIITTFIALRSLMVYEGSKHSFRQKDYSQKACQYLLGRQTKKGAFGRCINSISGIEIHPSIRHTSFAISSLIDLGGPPEAIINGIKYLCRNWSLQDFADDAAPSLAIAGTIYAFDKFITTAPYFQLLTDKEKDEIKFSDWPNSRMLLIRQLAEIAKSSQFSPLFYPYGKYETMLFDTALTTIDLISNPLSDILATTVVDILSTIVKAKNNNGIPYNNKQKYADIGLSAYLLSLIVRPGFLHSLNNTAFSSELTKIGIDIAHFLLKYYQNPKYKTFTYCDTFSNLLLIKSHGDIEL
jgi:hypothetical protein